MAKKLKNGVLLRVDGSGVGIVKDAASKKQYGFTFDKIMGYRGQPAANIGLCEGNTIKFTIKGDLIDSVILR